MCAFGDEGGLLSKGRIPQILAVLTATLSAISDGMHYGWTAPIIPILQSNNTPVAIQQSDVVWLENIEMLGAFAGIPIAIYTVDKFGRKVSILIAVVQNLISWILIAVASSVEILYTARFIGGLAADVTFVAVPMYVAEIADQNIRGFLSSLIFLMMLTGILVVYSVAPFVSILASSMVGALFVLIELVTFPFMPESPYFLLLKDNKEGARKSLQRLRATKNVEVELEEISAAVQRQKMERGRPIDLLIVDSNRKAMLIMTVLNGAQHFSSISVMLMNIHTILGDAASKLTPNTTAIIFAVVMLVSASVASPLIDKAGRKILLVSSSFLTGTSLMILASYFAVKNAGVDVSSFSWVPVAVVMLYAVSFKYGLGLVPIVMTAELFPTSVKALGITISDFMYVTFACISIFFYQFVADAYGMHVPFFVFGACCFGTGLFAAFCVPETKGKTLEEIQLLLKRDKRQLKSECNGEIKLKIVDQTIDDLVL